MRGVELLFTSTFRPTNSGSQTNRGDPPPYLCPLCFSTQGSIHDGADLIGLARPMAEFSTTGTSETDLSRGTDPRSPLPGKGLRVLNLSSYPLAPSILDVPAIPVVRNSHITLLVHTVETYLRSGGWGVSTGTPS